MNAQHPQIFNDEFEATWKDFDQAFRAQLLRRIPEMGSLHRLSGDGEEINREYSRRFYTALEETLESGQFIRKWKAQLVDPIPTGKDELVEVFRRHSVYPLHAFYLLWVYVYEYPLRAFFSGDVPLPFNTLTLKFDQLLSDPLPTGVDYELDMVRLDHCPGLAFASEAAPSYLNRASALPLAVDKKHPQHHWKDLIWVWHFGLGGQDGGPISTS